MLKILNSRPFFWLLIAHPSLIFLWGYFGGSTEAADMLHPTGEFAARFMILAMMLSPLVALIGPRRWLNWLVARRRALGVAAFGYTMLHLIFYLIDMGNLKDILAEWLAPGIWTGWAAFVLMVPLAATSNDSAMRAMQAGWKRLQRLVYPAALLTMLHWFWVHNNYGAALVHFTPLALLVAARFIKNHLKKTPLTTGA